MKILYLSPEMHPYAKVGGLADVAGSLPAALADRGHEVVVVLPKYGGIDVDEFGIQPTDLSARFHLDGRPAGGRFWKAAPRPNLDVYFLEHHDYYAREGLYGGPGGDYPDNLQRFANWCRAALELARALDWPPDVLHANDWQSAPAVIYLKTLCAADPFFARTKALFTIHNMAYQGYFPKSLLPATGLPWDVFTMDGVEFYGDINLMKGGIMYADWISTVSRTYAREIQTPEFGCGLEGVLEFKKKRLSGILNGVDYSEWNPESDPHIAAQYSARDLAGKARCKAALQEEFDLEARANIPVLGMVARLVEQKGIDLVAAILPDLLSEHRIQLVVLGNGERHYQEILERLAAEYPHALGLRVGFDPPLAHRIEAGADMFLMPSRHEPCGLNQMYSLRYGTPPIVRKTGGLADTIVNYSPRTGKGNGFVFSKPEAAELGKAVRAALKLFAERKAWTAVMKNAMAADFSWDKSAVEYEKLYRQLAPEPAIKKATARKRKRP
ncbi:glycogen synthase GlgA [bacterium]|nr:glycogen synthase GlgA [bacterium]